MPDEYGTCLLDDAPMLARHLAEGRDILFGYTADSKTAYVLFIAPKMHTVGMLPFGGANPGSRCAVGVLYKGFYHFDLHHDNFPDYVGEKLGLKGEDAEAVTLMLNAIGRALRAAQLALMGKT